MAALEFNIRQRIFLEILLGQQRGSVSDIEVFFDIRNKVKVDNRDEYLRALPTGEVIIDEVSVNSAGFEKIELEKEERKKLHELINTHKQFTPNDLEWVLPLKKQLEAAL
jgi:hypothetical protein